MARDLKEDALTALVRRFEEAEQSGVTARQLAARCRDYYDGKQLTEAEEAELARRGQPPIVINRIRRKIDWLRGLEAQSRTSPRAFPRTPQHQQGAEAATDAIRYVCEKEGFDRKRAAAWANILIEGIGGVEVVHEEGRDGEPDVVINYYPWDRLFHDPHSMEPDFSDARYLGVVIWSDADDLRRQYPGKTDEIEASIGFGGAGSSDTYEDKPYWQVWSDPKRRRVRQVLMHYRDGDTWHWARFVRGGILDEGESPYTDEDGESLCPLILQSAYVDRQGNRYGVVRDMLDPQDEINKRRSKLLHQLSVRQTVTMKGAVSVTAMKAALRHPEGNVEVDPAIADAAREAGMKPFEIVPTSDMAAGQLNLLQEAKAEIDLMGANSGLSGKDDSASQSGRAIMARQQGGLIEIAPLADGLSDFTRTVYRHVWLRIRQFWRAEHWVRVTDDERNIRFVGLNRRVTLRERLEQMPQEQVVMIARQYGLTPNDPRLDMPVDIENNVETLDIDITIEEVPSQVTLEGETFEQVVNIATSMPGAVPPEILIELAPGIKRDVKDRLLEHMQQSQQAQVAGSEQAAQAQAQMMEVDAAKKAAEAQRAQSIAAKTQIEAQRLALGY